MRGAAVTPPGSYHGCPRAAIVSCSGAMRLVVASLVLIAACAGERDAPAPPPPTAKVPPVPAAADAANTVDTSTWNEVQVRVLGMH